ncbi:glycosyltransferase family 2 protein [Armatimonas sp.]|uniref:glycosyltransferase family 2 protein n=1 Tax=Armatimonas sp. TaxID=1872638 RepID=UPI00374FE3AB
MPKISIVTPCYNAERFLGALIESVLRQEFTDWEYVIVDDGSTDGSKSLAEAYAARDLRIQVVSQSNGGVAKARNTGFKYLKNPSDYVYFLDADDVVDPQLFQVVTRYLDAHPEVGMVHTGHHVIGDDGVFTPTQYEYISGLPRLEVVNGNVYEMPCTDVKTTVEAILGNAGIIPSISIFRRDIYEQTPGFDENFGQPYEDSDVFLHMAIRSEIHYLPDKLVSYRRHSSQNTADNPDEERFNYLEGQRARLIEKWTGLKGFSPEQQSRLDEALFNYQTMIVAYQGFSQAASLWKERHFLKAFHFWGGGIRRWLRHYCRYRRKTKT